MSIADADIQAMVDRVNVIAIPAVYAGSFREKFNAWVFASSGGEIRNFLRVVDDQLVLSQAQRSNTDESVEFSSPSLTDMEKFLTYYFCRRLRGRKRLPMLLVVSIPVTVDKVAPGYRITDPGGPGYELHHRGDDIVRRGNKWELIEFSHYVALSPDEIRESALDPEGKPHFMVESGSRG
ncbi:Imm61 family immunity protein [Leifsonia sp. NPDC056824]|uniref:Imm61 family immunity protein n=1 Tax=Leifsonia sp. NPDC056824 TaxID=3345953 RepID=UPI0036CCEFA9